LRPVYCNELKKVVDEVWIIDTHEHLVREEDRVKCEVDPLSTFLPHYVSSDLASAGMSADDLNMIRNPSIPLEQRWEKFSPYWKKVQNTGYARALNIAVKDLYGFDGISDENYVELAKKMMDANKKGIYKWVLKEKAKIEVSILDPITEQKIVPVDFDRSLFAPVARFEEFIMPMERMSLESLATQCRMPIHALSDLVKALEAKFQEVSGALVGVKIALAYRRPLDFEKTTYAEAERSFNKIYSQRLFKRIEVAGGRWTFPEAVSAEEVKPLQDFMVHKLIQLAIKHNLPVQIHTGVQEGNENLITSANPTRLVNLFMEYKDAKFDILHGGYPYVDELAVIAKNFPNVYVDMAWLHIISPSVARRALSEWLDTVPSNKILGFGGDYRFVEGVYGHSVMARENIAWTLAEKVEDEGYSLKEAEQLAKKLLRDNASNLFFPRGLPPRAG